MKKTLSKQLQGQRMVRSLDAAQIMADQQARAGLFRHSEVRRIDEEKRTVELAFSSEEPVSRWFGDEILDHSDGAMRTGRLESGAALLMDHNTRDQVGVVESVSIGDDRRGRALVRFGRGARASEIWQDVVDGIRKHVSVGYSLNKVEVEERSGMPDLVRVIDWEPYEISLVSVPADPTVGVGRSAAAKNTPDQIIPAKGEKMEEKILRDKNGDLVRAKVDENGNIVSVLEVLERAGDAQAAHKAAVTGATDAERSRVDGLLALGSQYDAMDLARQFISEGKDENEMNKALLARMGKSEPITADSPEIGLTEKEKDSFSFVRALHALANPTDRRAQEAAAFEFEASRAAADRTGRDVRGILVPADVLKRDLTAGTPADGGDTVSTDLLSGSFIDLLRNRALLMQLGTVMTDLNGNVAIPRLAGGATAYWLAENGQPSESQQSFNQVAMTPKTVGAFTDISRRLLLQSSIDVEALTRSDLATVIALAIDLAGFAADGSGNQPTGILHTTGIGNVAGGTNGLAPTFQHMIDLETAVAVDNADQGRLGYVTNAKVRGKLKGTEKAGSTGQFVWSDSNMINGYNAQVTNQIPSDLVKGTSSDCSAIIYGNWADLLIGLWGGLDLTVDPYTNSTSGAVRVVAHQDVDIAVRHPESFAAMQDALTS